MRNKEPRPINKKYKTKKPKKNKNSGCPGYS